MTKPPHVGGEAEVSEDYQNGSGRMQSSSAPTSTPPVSTPAKSTPTTSAPTTPTPASGGAQQPPKAQPSDVSKAKQLADRISKTSFKPEELDKEVEKNIGSVGKQQADVANYTNYVRDELVARGLIQETKRKK